MADQSHGKGEKEESLFQANAKGKRAKSGSRTTDSLSQDSIQ
jgi:hypothetical protein